MMEPSAVLIFEHAPSEEPGYIAAALRRRGIPCRRLLGYTGKPIPATLHGAAGLVIMGGPMNVDEEKRYPFLRGEKRLIELALAARLPMLGVCLGSQLLAQVLGARVTKAIRPEIGWLPVTLLPAAGSDPLFGGVAVPVVLHWHGDRFDCPRGAAPLARSALTACQAFRYGAAHGLLFHMEVSPRAVEAMATAFPGDLAAAGLTRQSLARQTQTHASTLRRMARTVFSRWAARVR
jgi:GMP synthase-like glutamine amidotransferase